MPYSLALLVAVAFAHQDAAGMQVCRNLALDQHRGSTPFTTTYTIGGTSAGNTDSDVSALLDPMDTSKLSPTAYFDMVLEPSSAAIVGLDYSMEVSGVSAGILMGPDAIIATRTGNAVKVAIPTSSYQNANQIPWTDMRALSLSFEGGDDSTETKVSLVRVCNDFPSPSFCSITTSDEYATNCRDCNCQTCHECGCSTSSPWGSCGHGACDGWGCWCSPACKCCQDCEGYSCNCNNCCDTETVESCSLGGTYKVSSLSPANGIANEATDVLVTGTGFYRNAEAMTCSFGDVVVQATFVSSTSIMCTAPPIDLENSEEIRAVPFAVSLAAPDSTDPVTHSFNYFKCPNGCSDTCAAEKCQCAPGKFGNECQHECECVHGTCGSLSGFCSCEKGYTSTNCDVECPGGHESPCSNTQGSCYFDSDKQAAECECFEGFWGASCSEVCPKDSSGHVCSNRGICDEDTGACNCNPGFYGPDCEMECPGRDNGGAGCSGNGVCCTGAGASLSYTPCNDVPLGHCACDAGFKGSSCSEKYCFDNCYGNGLCSDGTCDCQEGWSGEFCGLPTGSDPSMSYFSFDASEIFTTEDIGTVVVNVTRYGSLESDVSVFYATSDLTANAGEDYVAMQNRLVWAAENADVKQVKIMVLKNSGIAEGEESFKITLSSPTPSGKCALGATYQTMIKIAAKDEDVSGNEKVARIKIHVLKDFAATNHEVMKAAFVEATLEATNIPHANLYIPANAVAYVENLVLSLQFDILPSNGADVGVLAKNFVDAVGDPSSAMYSEKMRQDCPIDISFQPDVAIVVQDQPSHKVKAASIILPVFFVLAITAGTLYYYRRKVRNYLLRKLAEWKFRELRDDDLNALSGQNPMREGLGGIFGAQTFEPVRRGWQSLKGQYFGGSDTVGFDDENSSELTDIRHSYSIDGGDDDEDVDDAIANFNRRSAISTNVDGDEVATMSSTSKNREGALLESKKQVLQIEL